MSDETSIQALDILPDGTRVFVRNAFLFGDIKSRMGYVRGFNVSPENQRWVGKPKMEYYVEFGSKLHWIPVTQIEGFLRCL